MEESRLRKPDLEQLDAVLRKRPELYEAWEMLWQGGMVVDNGLLETHHVLDVAYWDERGVPQSGGLDAGFLINLNQLFPSDDERANEIAKWQEGAVSQHGPLPELVLRLLCDDKTDEEIEGQIRDYMLAYDGTRLEPGQLLDQIVENRILLFKRFAASDRNDLITEMVSRGLIPPQPLRESSDD